MTNTLTKLNSRIKKVFFGEYKKHNYELEWRELVQRRNDQAKVAHILCSDEYENANLWKRTWIFLREVLPIDCRAAFNIPDHEIEALARCFLPDIIAYFESEEGRAEFAAWKAEQEKLEAEKKTRKTKQRSSVGEYER